MKRFLIILSGILSTIYLFNPGLGLFEFIPDNLPVVGNLDEGAAVYVIISVVSYLRGKDFGLFAVKQEEDSDDDMPALIEDEESDEESEEESEEESIEEID